MTSILITGAAGFAAHHFCEHFLKNTDWNIVALDKLGYASQGWDRLRDIDIFDDDRVKCISADTSLPVEPGVAKEIKDVDYILHMAAETHVDRSIKFPRAFVEANVIGTLNILEYARTLNTRGSLKQFIYFGTDEVFGPAPHGVAYKEWDRYDSRNPYAATKAAGEELSLSFANTYDLPVVVTHAMNLMGERQHPEKFIPSTIRKLLNNETVMIHANPENVPGSRFYIHCRNAADAMLFLMRQYAPWKREKFNIVGELEINNLDLATFVAEIMRKKLKYKLVDFHSSRPRHDLRYALDGSVLKSMGWEPPKTFFESLEKTIRWTLDNQRWLSL